MWSNPNTEDCEIEKEYERYRITAPFFSKLAEKFEDPSGKNRNGLYAGKNELMFLAQGFP